MTYQVLVTEIQQLALNERLLLLETLSRSVREELAVKKQPQNITPFESLRGMLKTDGPTPSDDELKEDYINYLIEKYA